MRSLARISRQEKASWAIPCNEDARGNLWVGKGFKKLLGEQFGWNDAIAILRALRQGRGNRGGRFWIDRDARRVTMMVGKSKDNEYRQIAY
jgi:hypothetical protein